jgi:hypothetical protein
MNSFLKIAFVLCGYAATLSAVPSMTIVKCQVKGTDKEFTTRGSDCTPQGQKDSCDKYSADPQIGAAIPLDCKTYNPDTEMNQFIDAAKQAALSQKNPQPPAKPVPAGQQAVPEKVELPVVTTCKINDPASARKDFVAPVPNTECVKADQQKECDRYAQVPDYGPATATDCQTFKTLDGLKGFLTEQAKTGRFPGRGGSAVLCETRGNDPSKKKYKYAVMGTSNDPVAMKQVCETSLGIADPIDFKSFPTDRMLDEYLKKTYPKLHGIECQVKVGGIAVKMGVPDCSEEVKKQNCKPKFYDVKGCSLFPNAQELKKWIDVWANPAFVTCRQGGQSGGMTVDIPEIPARDCDPETLKKVCIKGIPVGCKYRDVEKLRRGN